MLAGGLGRREHFGAARQFVHFWGPGMLKRLAGILGLAVSGVSHAGAAEPVPDLVGRVLAAYGGVALPAEGTMFRTIGWNWSARRSAEGAMFRELRWPDYLRVEIAYTDGGRESRVLIGDRGWRDGVPEAGPMLGAMKLQAARLALPMLLGWEADRLADLGEAIRADGIQVRRLSLELGDGLALFVEIDPAEGRILRSAGVITSGGKQMDFAAAYGEFQGFGALSLPTREEQSAMGQSTGWTVIESIELDVPFERDALHP